MSATSRSIALISVVGFALGQLAAGCRCSSFSDVDPYRCDGPMDDCGPDRVCVQISTGDHFCVVPDPNCPCNDDNPCNGVEGCDGSGGCIAGTPIDCTSLTDTCSVGVCNSLTGACEAAPLADGASCDDGMFCTDPDFCTAGVCGGSPLDCSGVEDTCNGSSCNEALALCEAAPVADGTPCDDGLFCSLGETCTSGSCGGGSMNPCDDANGCTADSCDEALRACVNDGAPLDGMPCDDGMFCTIADSCSGGSCGGPPLCDDGATCTTDVCNAVSMSCGVTPDEPSCGGGQICNPIAYPGGSGCGTAPSSLAVSCGGATAGSPVTCTLDLTTGGGTGVPGEADRIFCTARPGPIQLFSDNFDSGSFDPLWMPSNGTPEVNNDLPGSNNAAVAVDPNDWRNELTLGVTGLSEVCVDFDIAQENANAGERIRWQVEFDGGGFATVFDIDFDTWEDDEVIFLYNRNVCVPVPGGASDVTWRLRLDTGDRKVYVDNVVVTGIGAPFMPTPPMTGPDPFNNLSGWSTVSGSPQVGTYAGSSVLSGEGGGGEDDYEIDRSVDASACDVLDVNFDFGFNNPDGGERIELSASVDGGSFFVVEDLDLADNGWNDNSVLLSWFGLRRISDLDPAAAGSSNVTFRYHIEATGGGKRVYADEFEALCADIPDPTISSITDLGGGLYEVDIDSGVPAEVLVECIWATSDDGPLTDQDVATFTP